MLPQILVAPAALAFTVLAITTVFGASSVTWGRDNADTQMFDKVVQAIVLQN